MGKIKNKKGITLIALVITIIVLLILAGVSLSLIVGGDGILGKAESAVDANQIATAKEDANLLLATKKIEYYDKKFNYNEDVGKFGEYLKKELENGLPTESGDYKVKIDSDGNVKIITNDEEEIEYPIIGTLTDDGEITWTDTGSKKYVVAYDVNGGTGSVPKSLSYEAGTEITLNFEVIPTMEEYKFIGWSTNKNATKPEYTSDGINTYAVPTSKTTFYAVWAEKIKPNYGTAIQSNYENLYLSSNPQVSLNVAGGKVDTNAQGYIYRNGGNYYAGPQLTYWYFSLTTPPIPVSKENLLNQTQGPSNQAYIYSGTKQYNFTQETAANRWIACLIRASFATTNVTLSGFKLIFEDGNTYNLNDSVNQGYIEPLVVCDSASNNASVGYWDVNNVCSGGATNQASHAALTIVFKVKDKAKLKGVELNSNINFNTTETINNKTNTDGLYVRQAKEEFDISITPFDV